MQICQVFHEYQSEPLNEFAFCNLSTGTVEQVKVFFGQKKGESKYQRIFPGGNINACVQTCIRGHAATR